MDLSFNNNIFYLCVLVRQTCNKVVLSVWVYRGVYVCIFNVSFSLVTGFRGVRHSRVHVVFRHRYLSTIRPLCHIFKRTTLRIHLSSTAPVYTYISNSMCVCMMVWIVHVCTGVSLIKRMSLTYWGAHQYKGEYANYLQGRYGKFISR